MSHRCILLSTSLAAVGLLYSAPAHALCAAVPPSAEEGRWIAEAADSPYRQIAVHRGCPDVSLNGVV